MVATIREVRHYMLVACHPDPGKGNDKSGNAPLPGLFSCGVIERFLELEAFHLRRERGIVHGLDQLRILQQVKVTLLLDQIDDFRVFSQGNDPRIFCQLLRSRVGKKTLCASRVGNHGADLAERLVGSVGHSIYRLDGFA